MRLDLFVSYNKIFLKKLSLLPLRSDSEEAIEDRFFRIEYKSLEEAPRRY
jgi:hypothetical protein